MEEYTIDIEDTTNLVPLDYSVVIDCKEYSITVQGVILLGIPHYDINSLIKEQTKLSIKLLAESTKYDTGLFNLISNLSGYRGIDLADILNISVDKLTKLRRGEAAILDKEWMSLKEKLLTTVNS